MKPSAAKEKNRQLTRSRPAHRASGPSRSYPKTRIRGSRLFEAAFILAIAELSRRLHQAYAHAYDKQAAGSVLPQNPQPQRDTRTDCHKFADIVDEIAKAVFVDNKNPSTNSYPHNLNYFMDRLAQRFTGMRSATIWSGALRGGGHRPIAGFNAGEFGSSGFREQFYERPPGNNQVMHAVGGLIAGYSGIGLERMNARENANDPRGRNDINLNNQTVPMGESLLGGGDSERRAQRLGQWIRDTLCTP